MMESVTRLAASTASGRRLTSPVVKYSKTGMDPGTQAKNQRYGGEMTEKGERPIVAKEHD